MIPLSAEKRASTYYLAEVDGVKSRVSALEEADATLTHVKEHNSFDTPMFTPWDDSMLVFYDFADENDLGHDCTGNGRHGVANGAYQVSTSRGPAVKSLLIVRSHVSNSELGTKSS